MPGVFNVELEELLGVHKVIYEIIFDQTSRTTFAYYSRDIPHSTFTRVRGERSDIPEGPPNYDSNGNKITSEEDFSPGMKWTPILMRNRSRLIVQQWTKVKELERAIP